MTTLQDFMISRVRTGILELFFSHVAEMYYVREITRLTKEEINAVRRELERLLGCGILRSEERGNRLYYSLNPRYAFFQELESMVTKSTGLGLKLRKLQRKLGEVSFIMFSGRFVRRLQVRQGDLDILVVGTVVLPELDALIKEAEKTLTREINYTVLTSEEFEFRKTRRDPFIMDVLYGTRIMVIGSEDDFVERKVPGL